MILLPRGGPFIDLSASASRREKKAARTCTVSTCWPGKMSMDHIYSNLACATESSSAVPRAQCSNCKGDEQHIILRRGQVPAVRRVRVHCSRPLNADVPVYVGINGGLLQHDCMTIKTFSSCKVEGGFQEAYLYTLIDAMFSSKVIRCRKVIEDARNFAWCERLANNKEQNDNHGDWWNRSFTG